MNLLHIWILLFGIEAIVSAALKPDVGSGGDISFIIAIFLTIIAALR